MNDDLTAIFLSSSNHLINGLVAIVFIIGPLWLILHYITKFRATRQLNTADMRAFKRLNQLAARMESRMAVLERILDVENPDWYQTPDLGVRTHEPI